jgi:hypothetical protein
MGDMIIVCIVAESVIWHMEEKNDTATSSEKNNYQKCLDKPMRCNTSYE